MTDLGAIDGVESRLDTFEAIVARGAGLLARRVEAVSAWSVAQHVDHVGKVTAWFLKGAVAGWRAPEGTPGINLAGRLVLALGWMPRGRGRAPEPVRGLDADAATLRASLAACRERIAALRSDPELVSRPGLALKHPIFEGLTAAQAVRFAEVHAAHHAKIVRDIVEARG